MLISSIFSTFLDDKAKTSNTVDFLSENSTKKHDILVQERAFVSVLQENIQNTTKYIEKNDYYKENKSDSLENQQKNKSEIDEKDSTSKELLEKNSEKLGIFLVINSLNIPLSKKRLINHDSKTIKTEEQNVMNNLKNSKNISKLQQNQKIIRSGEKLNNIEFENLDFQNSTKLSDITKNIKKGATNLVEAFEKKSDDFETNQEILNNKINQNIVNFANISEKSLLNLKDLKNLKKQSISEKIDFNSQNISENLGVNSQKNTQIPIQTGRSISKAVINQIEEHIHFMKSQGKQRVTLQLQPEHLGAIEIKVTKTEKEMKILFQSDNKETLQILQQNRDELKNIVTILKNEDGFYSGLDLSFSQFSQSQKEGKNSSHKVFNENILEESMEITGSIHQGIIEVVV